MWLIGSTPSKPASLTALNFSNTEPLKPIVAYMIPFLSERFLPGTAAGSAALSVGARAAMVMAVLLCLRNSRRERDVFIRIFRRCYFASCVYGNAAPG